MIKTFLRAAALVLLGSTAQAATVPAVDVTYDAYTTANAWNGVQGYAFHVNKDVAVTALGAWDYLGNGFQQSNGSAAEARIGLFSLTGELLGSTSITGAAGRLIGQFRYADLAAQVRLVSGMDYVLGSWTNDFNSGFNANYGRVTLVQDPRIALIRNRDLPATGGLAFPSREPGNTHLGSFGPNMLIDDVQVAPVPLPAGGLLLVSGLGLAALVRRKRA